MNKNTLLSYVKSKITPSQDQEKLLSSLNDFIESKDKIFIMKGYAGTGKTTITKYIVEFLSIQIKENKTPIYRVSLAAYTGRAAMILKNKTGFNATTIHKLIYNYNKFEEVKTGNKFEDQKKFKIQFKLITDKVSDINQIIIIDEASMISNSYTEDDFYRFGSGFLLNDLMEYATINNTSINTKIIFIGDPAQLPPVNENTSKALSTDYITQEYNITPIEYTLTQVMRHQKESGILDNATILRNLISSQKKNNIKFLFNNYDFIKIDLESVIDNYIKHFSIESIDNTILINFTNKSSLNYNLQIKERLNKKNEICIGDILMAYSNNYNYAVEIFNGSIFKVVEIGKRETKNHLKTYTKDQKIEHISLTFLDIVIEIENDGKKEKLQCKIIEDFLFSEIPQLNYSQNIALYLDFLIRNGNLKKGTEEFKSAMKNDVYFNALRVKFGYSITAHKAQGGEWKNAIINLDSNISKLCDQYLRFAYTAITRSSEKEFIFNAPNITLFNKFDYKALETFNNNDNETIINFNIPNNFESILDQFQVTNISFNRLQKFKNIYAITQYYNIDIKNRFQENEYKEIYEFSLEDKTGTLIFNLKKNDVYSSIQKSNKKSSNQDFESFLFEIMEQKKIVNFIDINDSNNIDLSEYQIDKLDKKHIVKPLYDELFHRFKKEKIIITNIECYDFHDLFTLKSNHESAVIQFYRNQNNEYTSAIPVKSKCNDISIIKKINSILETFKSEIKA